MAAAGATQAVDRQGEGQIGTSLVFVLIFAYFWITLTPLSDLSTPDSTLSGDASNLVNQLVVVGMSAAAIVAAWSRPARAMLLRPRGFLLLVLGWFTLTSLLGNDPSSALKRVVFAVLVCVCANIALTLPSSPRRFAKLLGLGLFSALALSFIGVAFFPKLAIHQATDAVEAVLAGDWRGIWGHKNIASAAMAVTVFGGLYVAKTWSKLLGWLIVIGASIFVYFAGGKSSAAILPAILVLAWMFEHWRWARVPLVLGGVLLLNVFTVGAAIFPPLTDFVTKLGVDATFTDRADIWRLSFSAIESRPLTGYGFQTFWQTNALVNGGGGVETWAVNAANSHNAYVEALINGGIPGLVLVVVWILVLPIRDAAKADTSGNDPALTRLFTRIWLYSIFAACLESTFFLNVGPVWFTLLLAVFGLKLQGNAQLVEKPEPVAQGGFAHA